MRVASRDYPGEIAFAIDRSLARAYDWADYARGAAMALGATHSLVRGVSVLVEGALGEAGISSSAAVGLGYLLALATANELELESRTLIELDRIIENEFLGLRNGVLDQSAIALAQAGSLSVIDCATVTARHVEQPDAFAFLVVFGGVREALIGSDKFNGRVEECFTAGAMLWEHITGERTAAVPLGRVARADWERCESTLPPLYRRRAAHYFGEAERVLLGAEAWGAGDRARFGSLMIESCLSSVRNYETGSPEMIALFEALSACSGVWGARFSGAGFRGCAIALVEAARAADIAAELEARYLRQYPRFADSLWAFSTTAGPGLRLL
jgi:galacturonokinase